MIMEVILTPTAYKKILDPCQLSSHQTSYHRESLPCQASLCLQLQLLHHQSLTNHRQGLRISHCKQ